MASILDLQLYKLTGLEREKVKADYHEIMEKINASIGFDRRLYAQDIAGSLAHTGDKSRAAEIIRQMGASPTPVMGRVLYHLLCSETDEAADWYEKAIEQREPFALIIAAAPCNRVLRESPRWPALAKMMNLPESLAPTS